MCFRQEAHLKSHHRGDSFFLFGVWEVFQSQTPSRYSPEDTHTGNAAQLYRVWGGFHTEEFTHQTPASLQWKLCRGWRECH